MYRNKSLFFFLSIILIILASGCHIITEQASNNLIEQSNPRTTIETIDSTNDSGIHHVLEKNFTDQSLSVYYLDVGQGDSTLVKASDGSTILIDTGRHDQDEIVSLLQTYDVTKIDLLVLTHGHADHIGQTKQVLQSFPVKEVWMSGDIHTSKTFEYNLDAILASSAAYYEPRAGEEFEIGNILIEVINPLKLTGDLHEGCLALRLSFGEISFLFTGDIESHTESDIIERGHKLQSTIFQLGHHGSSTSNSVHFLKHVQPELAIYSAANGNSYGHPHTEVILNLESMDIPYYGTEHYGTIIVETDGLSYTVEFSK